MKNNITYLQEHIHKILFDWSDGFLAAPFNPKIEYVTSLDSKVRKEVIEIFHLVGEKFDPYFEELEPDDYYEICEENGALGTWGLALITISINLKQEVIDVEAINSDSFGTPLYLLSVSKPER